MKRYVRGRIHQDAIARGTEKAFWVEVDDGRWAAGKHNKSVWIPRSVCVFEDPNEFGWQEVLVPEWVFRNARVDYHRVLDLTVTGIEVR